MGVRPAGRLGPALSHAQGQSSSPGRPFPGIRCHFLPPFPRPRLGDGSALLAVGAGLSLTVSGTFLTPL